MARVLGYGGLANTNGARDFSGKEVAAVIVMGGIGRGNRLIRIPTDRRISGIILGIGAAICQQISQQFYRVVRPGYSVHRI